MKNSSEDGIDRNLRRYLAGMMIGLAAGIAIGIALGNIAIGIAIGGGIGVSMGMAFQEQDQETGSLQLHPITGRLVALFVGILILVGLAAILFLVLF